jgi:hypothetical protein
MAKKRVGAIGHPHPFGFCLLSRPSQSSFNSWVSCWVRAGGFIARGLRASGNICTRERLKVVKRKAQGKR